MNRRYKWRFHFNAMHNITPETEAGKHTHSFLVILYMEVTQLDLEKQNTCEKALKEYLNQYNGKYLNEMEKFLGKIPTLEIICETLYEDTKQIAAVHGMEQVKMEVGDSPIALFGLGKEQIISAEAFEKYKQQLDMTYGEGQGKEK